MTDDIFNYRKYWNPEAIRKRKENKMYEKEETDQVLEDVAIIVDRFLDRLEEASNLLEHAMLDLATPEAIHNLASAEAKINSVKLTPVIDTVQGIIENA